MVISVFFSMLGAPLSNKRWSWGAVRPDDGAVFLRVWRDEQRQEGDSSFVRILLRDHDPRDHSYHGYSERLGHLELVKKGAPCYLIMCVAVDPKAIPRAIKDFDRSRVFPAGRLKEVDGDLWIERLSGVPISEVRPR